MRELCYGSVCSGIEAASIAWEPLGMRPAWFAETEPFPSAVLAHRWPHVANLGDMTKLAIKVLAGEIESPDVLVGGTPCFTAGHMVLCKNGYKPIEDVCPGDYVVSHLGRLQQVKRVGSKIANTGLLNAVGQPLGIRTTNDHPFLAVRWKAQNTRKNGTYFKRELLSEPEWRAACDMPEYQWCALTNFNIASPDICSRFLSEEQAMYLAGAYVGDGYIRRWRGKSKKAVVFGINCQKLRKFHCRIPENIFSVASEIRGSIKVTLNDTCYANWLNEHFGELSHAKRIPAWVMSHPLRHVFLQGYLDTDGTPSGKAGFRINSVSPALAWGVAELSQTCGYVSSVSFIEVEPKKVIEERVVNQRNYYQVTICPQKLSRKSRLAHGMLLRTVKEFKSVGLDTVYNIEVEGDHSYILNGAVVHNCQAFSIAGLRGGLDDERGALTLKYVELANAIDDKRAESFLKPAVIVWENVPGVLSSADNAFGCFLAGLAGEDAPFEPGDRPESGKSNAFWRWDGKTGCHAPKWPQCGCIYGPQRKVAWRILDAQYFGVAQRRRRVFVVASARTDLDPATVLFEFEGVRRDIAPSRGEGKETTRYTSNIAIRTCDDTNIIAMAHGQGGAEIKTDNSAPTLTCNHEAPIVLLGDGRMRRLTPIECERLQGFPDGHTLIPTEKRKTVNSDELAYLRNHYPDLSEEEAAMLAADGPRYKAIGNSMAIPVMRWIGDRITKAVCRQKEGSETKERKVKPAAEFERSIFKWAGGKFGVLEQIFRYLPEGKRLIEPFVGGGAVFMNAGYQENLLNDVNADLINFYKTLQREAHSLITLAHRFFQGYNTQEGYLAVRNAFNKQVYDDLHRAAAFLFLNRHCFNGLTRYNQAGEFNVGYGKYKTPYFPLQEMEAFLGAEGRSEFVCGDFAAVIEAAGEGDVIFCDPPYEPLPNTEGFTNYSGHDFKFEEQKRLVSLLTDAHRRGAKVLITNSGAPNIRELYHDSGFRVEPLFARRSVSCKGDTRGVAHDVIAILL
ncbi:Dam family site-specific DNA-(adenine-N6)-methyltransferase [Salmonella enterica subsp. enterica serovar Typhimurium]|uniref:site-specific DNA-methyltransferase (adenine-specific) n=1 Tax=Salmonella enterica TaxID=28901 RepID=A0A722CM86_SALER|nr:Dam family site-specific DNA-(adenine-N6)-methyltransferase [Escherichia fergusonii]EAA0968418.1 DNA methyltransferase [Salmonella enterica subsp. enterica]EAT5106024.1 Dam family site-specific DNA-(adenine-N6)-methyltransferase [Salmonella enterica]ECN2928670.1 Dam family site-specific DNA-(adenine-N6)-methyltransferase [Salmonella enterica subsp. enterica serovar Typhimurium]EDX3416446.1 Dam family site-specific DNA-(adenine-N6)-methyltransferase [Salmonella enterica subsp. enterica serova